MNPRKSTIVTCIYKHNIDPCIKLADENMPQLETVKYLAATLGSKLVMNAEITDLIQRIRFRIR